MTKRKVRGQPVLQLSTGQDGGVPNFWSGQNLGCEWLETLMGQGLARVSFLKNLGVTCQGGYCQFRQLG